jgi:DNA-directed RNA polymerase specialized sigma24 family protein
MQTVINELRSYLPYARRFARALTGSQEGGDALIIRALEAFVADRSLFTRYSTPQKALYAALLRIGNAGGDRPGETSSSGDPTVRSADRKLQALTSRSRQAFLLANMEGFGIGDIADILDTSEVEVRSQVDEASKEIAAQIRTDVLIIEDEPLVAMDLEAAMEEIGHRVLGIASTRDEALRMIAGRKPGLLLVDIQLADGSSGIDTANDMLTNFSAPTIFITAFPERLLTGEKPEPVFLITKPFDVDIVKAVTSQALFFDQKATKSVV